MKHNIDIHLLLPRSSHLLQPLDVGVFRPLKKTVSAETTSSWDMRLEKFEWAEACIKGREVVLTKSNVLGEWHGAGLVQLNRVRVTRSLPDLPTTSPTFEDLLNTSSAPDAIDLRTLNAKLGALVVRNAVNTPARHAILLIVRVGDRAWAENVTLKRQLADIERALTTRKEYKTDKRAILRGENEVTC
jgi:hypothetical protein